ncbi:MAG: FGGY-family carbohydrate kinase [Spirochaetes bacterium]|nr:FGGY-family carbohydrate kinase [Spirochaetota bacterium]
MILAVDIGTTSAKAALFGRDGSCVSTARADVRARQGNGPRGLEIDPESWLAAFRTIITFLASDFGSLALVECVVVSGQGPTIFPVGPSGEVLHPAITWMDRRAAAESAAVEAALGRPLDPAYNLPKALWFKEHLPEIYERTRWFSSCPEFVCAYLCGSWVTFLPAEGYEAIIWDDASLDKLGLDKAKFPPFAALGSVIGRVLPKASAETGLPAGTLVVAGGPDFIVSLIGTATVAPRRACDRSGTSEGINLCWEKGLPRDPRLLYMPHFVSPYENISGVISATGGAVSWFMEKAEPGMDHEEFFRLVSATKPGAGSLLFLPYLAGERAPLWDPDARGAFLGLSMEQGQPEMARAVAESTGFAMRDIIDVMESTGAEVKELRATGQPSGNGVWNQIKADITRKPIAVPAFWESELLGGLCLGLVALGDYGKVTDAAEKLVRIDRVYEPNASVGVLYDELFGIYRSAYPSLKPLFGALTHLRREG